MKTSKATKKATPTTVCTTCRDNKFRTYKADTYPCGTRLQRDSNGNLYCFDCGNGIDIETVSKPAKKAVKDTGRIVETKVTKRGTVKLELEGAFACKLLEELTYLHAGNDGCQKVVALIVELKEAFAFA